MVVTLTEQAIATIEMILKHGNDAVVYRNKDGVVIAEQSRTIKYRTFPSGGKETAIRVNH